MSQFEETKMRHDALMADLFWNDMVAEAKVYLINKHLANGDLRITDEGVDFVDRKNESRVAFGLDGEKIEFPELDNKRWQG
ncbi:MAG: hypothetical protein L0G51_00140 [Lactococcus lactis]|nr:hypothetical protein [Lactococcus lactis]